MSTVVAYGLLETTNHLDNNDYVVNSDNLAHVNCERETTGARKMCINSDAGQCDGVLMRASSDIHTISNGIKYNSHSPLFFFSPNKSRMYAIGRHFIYGRASSLVRTVHIRCQRRGAPCIVATAHKSHSIEVIGVAGERIGFVLCQCLPLVLALALCVCLGECENFVYRQPASPQWPRQRRPKSQRLYIFFNTKESPVSRHVNRIYTAIARLLLLPLG